MSIYYCLRSYYGNSGSSGRRYFACPQRRVASTVPKLAVRTGIGQLALESRLQGHPDKRHGTRVVLARKQNTKGNAPQLPAVLAIKLYTF